MAPTKCKRRLVWLPHPKAEDAIGDALRACYPIDAVEALPADTLGLLSVLVDLEIDDASATLPETAAAGGDPHLDATALDASGRGQG